MANCPAVITDTGLRRDDPCNGSVCWAWYLSAWKAAAEREYEIASQLSHVMTDDERAALAKAREDFASVPAVWRNWTFRPAIEAWATIAQALRCLWFAVAERAHGKPPVVETLPATASAQEKKAATKAWWAKWLPDLGSWVPSLSWPELPGFEIALKSVWEKLKSWFRAALPWIIGGVALWLFAPTIVRSIAAGVRK